MEKIETVDPPDISGLAWHPDLRDPARSMGKISAERALRHMQAAHRSDFEHLRDSLRDAAGRLTDVADILEKDRTYDPVPFLRASAARYKAAAELED